MQELDDETAGACLVTALWLVGVALLAAGMAAWMFAMALWRALNGEW